MSLLARRRAACAALIAALAGSGCASRPGVHADSEPREGQVGVHIESPGREGSHLLRAGESARRPVFYDIEQPLPDYPRSLLELQLPTVRVLGLLSIDANGELSAVAFPSEQASAEACDAHCMALFEAAVREAVTSWSFGPLEIIGFVDGPDEDGDGEADSVDRAVVATRPYSLRLRFTFDQVDGIGSVRRQTFD